ncbi:condensation domain-containing protein, partial [Streptomyces sp. MN13]
LRLRGELDHTALHAAVGDVVARHEALRTVFPDRDGHAHQMILDGAAADVPVRHVPVADDAELHQALRKEVTAGFDLARELPLRVTLFSLGERQEHVLSLVLHHIAGDGWSMAPLARDLATAYTARLAGGAPEWEP